MAKKKTSKMSAKARMAYVRSFIGKKKGKRGGSLKEQMDYVRSFRGKNKSGGKFPKGTISEWRAKANSGSSKKRAVYKRAIENWNKLMSKAGFKEKWNANKIKKGGALEDNVNYSQLISAYKDNNNRSFGFGGGIRGYGIRGAGIRGYGIRGAGIRGYGIRGYGLPKRQVIGGPDGCLKKGCGIRGYGIRGYGIRGGAVPPLSAKMAKKFDEIFKRHVRQGAGLTKKDLYRGAGKANSLFFTRNRILKRQKKKPVTMDPPSVHMIKLYRDLYKDSGIHPENMIDPIVRNDRLQGGNFFKKVGNAVAKPFKFVKKHKIASTAASFIPGPAGVAARAGAKILGAGLIEEAGLNGRGHPAYIYH